MEIDAMLTGFRSGNGNENGVCVCVGACQRVYTCNAHTHTRDDVVRKIRYPIFSNTAIRLSKHHLRVTLTIFDISVNFLFEIFLLALIFFSRYNQQHQ